MRVSVINPRTGEALDWDSPAQEVTFTRALSLASMIEVTYPAWYNARTDEQGHPVILKGGSILVIEEDSGRLTVGLIAEDSLADDLRVSALGLSTLAQDTPWTREAQAWKGYDALRAFRFIWNHIITGCKVPYLQVTGDLDAGVDVGRDGTATWKRVNGQIEDAKKFLTQRDNKVEYWEKIAAQKALKLAKAGGRKSVGTVTVSNQGPTSEDARNHGMHIRLGKDSKPEPVHAAVVEAVYYWNWEGVATGQWTRKDSAGVKTAAKEWMGANGSLENTKASYKNYETRVKELEDWLKEHYPDSGPEPYELNWWSTRDLSKNLEEIREVGGFDWHETAEYDDQDRLVSAIHAVKKMGHELPYLFELGVNIHSHPEMHRGEVATDVTVMGAGEGETTLAADRAWSHPRLVRLTRTVSEKDLGTQQLVAKAADRELAKAKAGLEWQFLNLVITDTPAAPLDQIDLGDVITITGRLSDGSDLQRRVRIREITRAWSSNAGFGDSIGIEVEPA